MRVYELAKRLNTPNRRVIEIARDLGISINDHLATLSIIEVRRLRREIQLRERAN